MTQKIKNFIVNGGFYLFVTIMVISIFYLLVSLAKNIQDQQELEEKIRNSKYQSPDTPAYYLRMRESEIKWRKE